MQNKNSVLVVIASTTLLFACTSVHAVLKVDAEALECHKSPRLISQNFFRDSQEDMQSCSESVYQVTQQKMIELFPDVVKGFVGDPINDKSNRDKVIIERLYIKGEQQLEVQLGVGSFMATVAQTVADSTRSDITKTRIEPYTVLRMATDDIMHFFILFQGGAAFTVSTNTVASYDVFDFIRAFPVEDLEKLIE